MRVHCANELFRFRGRYTDTETVKSVQLPKTELKRFCVLELSGQCISHRVGGVVRLEPGVWRLGGGQLYKGGRLPLAEQ